MQQFVGMTMRRGKALLGRLATQVSEVLGNCNGRLRSMHWSLASLAYLLHEVPRGAVSGDLMFQTRLTSSIYEEGKELKEVHYVLSCTL